MIWLSEHLKSHADALVGFPAVAIVRSYISTGRFESLREEGERASMNENPFMSTYIDNHSESSRWIRNPTLPGPGFRTDSRIATVAAEGRGREGPSVSSNLRAGDLFQDSLIASGGKSRPRNLWAATGSLIFELLVLSAVVVVPLFHTEPLSKPETLTRLYAPPAAAAFHVTTLRVPTSTYTSRTISTPDTPHKTEEAPPVPEGSTGGVVGGIPGGVVGVVPGLPGQLLVSTSGMPVLAKTIETTPHRRVRVASGVAAANLIHDVAPEYPPEAGRARIEGTVVLLAVIGKDGCVRDVQVKSGVPLLVQAAIQAVKQWRYRPYLLNGEPVEVDSQITIHFTLSRG